MRTEDTHAGARTRGCLLVLGMHRSGTSALTRVLSLMGAALPLNVMGPAPSNPTGHWEPERLVALHDQMLAEAGSSWDDWRKLDLAAQLPHGRLDHYKAEIRRLVEQEYGDAPLFVLKDPRISRFVPLYREVLGAMSIHVWPVLIVRSPLAVAASLETRNAFVGAQSQLYWLRHVLDAEAATRELPRAVVSYERLLEDWREALGPVAAQLGLEWPRSLDDATAEIDAFLSPDQNHHPASPEALAATSGDVPWLAPVYAALLSGTFDDLDRIAAEFTPMAQLFGASLAAERVGRKDALSASKAEVVRMRREIEAERTARAQAETAHQAEVERLRSEMEAERVEREEAQAAQQAEFARMQAELAASRLTQQSLQFRARELQNRLDVERETHASAAKSAEVIRLLASPLSSGGRGRSRLQNGAPTQVSSLTSIRVDPVSANQLELVAHTNSALQLAMTGGDAWLLFDFSKSPLVPGYYELSWYAPSGVDAMSRPKMYVDTGQGFSEDNTVLVAPRLRGGKAFVVLTLQHGANRLRFDVSDLSGEISFGGFTLRRRGRIEHHLRLAAGLARSRIRSRADFTRAVRTVAHIARTEGLKSLARHLRAQANRKIEMSKDYQRWIALYDTITDDDRSAMREIAASWQRQPFISVVMPTYNTPERLLREAIDSVLDQTYENWELCIADDASTDGRVRKVLEEYSKRDLRIKVMYREQNGHISRASNSAIDQATGSWIAFLDHDDRLAPHALFCVAASIKANSTAKLFYSDEDKIDLQGTRADPYFKCDWNPTLFKAHNLITHLAVYEAGMLRELGGLRTGFEGAQDYDLAIRFTEQLSAGEICHIPHVLYHWRMFPGSTALGSHEKPYAMLAGERALNDHYQRTDVKAKAELIGHGFRTDFALPNDKPLVSIIIPTRNAWQLVKQCIDSITEKTTYPNYEIVLVDNGSDESESVRYFDEIRKGESIRLLRDDSPFNFSALNNMAVRQACGLVICLLNNDIEVITPEWLTRMVSIAIQPGTGAVGAKLLYPDNTLQHGGVIMGLGGLAAHAHWRFPRTSAGYVARAALDQNFSAVTAACLVVRKELYEAVGGLNETDLAVAYNDVDFCLKLRQLGLRNVWTPFAELYHHESATRGYETTPEKKARFAQETAYMLRTWPEAIRNDPAYNPNLTLDRADFGLAFPPRKELPWRS